MWIFYELLLLLGFLLYLPKALWRRRLPHRGWSMRLGRYPTDVTHALQGRNTLWVHAVSVGEVLSAKPLIQELIRRYPEQPLVLSTVTHSGFDVATKAVEGKGVPIYFPLDMRMAVTRALDAIRPRALLLMESELWPMMIWLAKARDIPIAVVNGRISGRAFRRYGWIRPWLKGMLRRVDLFLMQSQIDADRILALGAPAQRVKVTGNSKWDASRGTRPTPTEITALASRLGLRQEDRVLVGGSTHRGEEQVLLHAFQTLRSTHPTLRLIVAPRHLERLAEVEGLIRHAGFTPVRLLQATPSTSWEVGVIDTFGQLAQYYDLATVVFIGGSLIPHGGQNPLEAVSLGKPIVYGPSMDNFAAISHQLLAHHAARQIASAEELTPLFKELLDHPVEAQAMGRRGQELTEQFCGATQRILEALTPLLARHPTWPQGYG
ncbi:MAG: 3-deoxy-D-manno-octulosonic acid transferase [Candidatus Omnitrophica bacterium]|nr:3-deoxy-D-manno-octulosonic acid transferase [Candidatus Omnitrophota bacterium]